jgi:sigma-B regulation protein RsbU (phosphoserine phosphatase)
MSDSNHSNKDSSLKQLDERLLELTSLFEISRSLTSSLSIHAILENILRIPMGHMLISRGMILLKKAKENDFILEEVKGIPHNLLGKSLTIDSPPAHAKLLMEIRTEDTWLDFFNKFEIEILLPLNSSQGSIGIVAFGKKISGEPFSEREIEFLDSLSNIAASSVANGMMVEEIQKVNRNLDRKVQQLNTIFDIGRELNITLDRKKIGSLMSFAVMGELLVNKCVIFTKDDGKMVPLVAKGVDPLFKDDSELCEISEPLILDQTSRCADYLELGFAVLVPMRIQDETKGIMALGSKISGTEFDEADIEFLTTLGNQAMSSLENARLFEETLEKQRMEEELNLARNIQQGLLPSELPQFKEYEIAAKNIPSRQVGGDYFDIIPISETIYGIAIADVSGKGAGAALLMANLQASLHALASSGIGISDMVSRINNLIFKNTGLDKFITFFYGQLDIEKHVFTFCNAGHNPPYMVNPNKKIRELMAGGIVLGMMADMTFETASVILRPGDRIVMFTDGITEAMNIQEVEYGEKRLKNILQNQAELSALDLLEKIQSDVETFSGEAPQADDITLVVIKKKGR